MKEAAAIDLLSQVGRWHVEKTLILGFCLTPLSWHYLSYPLFSIPKDFKCSATIDGNSTNQKCFIDQEGLNPCENWTFVQDGTLSLQEDFGLVCHKERLLSLRQTIFFLGMLIGCLITGIFSDKYGRKPTMLTLMAMWSFVSILHAVVLDYASFLVLQFLLVI